MYRILSLSGGGIRGIYQAHFLKNVVQSFPKKPFCENFELIAGTSTGSIVAAGIACEKSLEEIIELFEQIGPKIFARRRFSYVRSGSHYSNVPLKTALKEIFQGRTLKQARQPLLITSTVLDPYYKPRVISNFTEYGLKFIDPDLKIEDIVLASCAAPSYFNPTKMEGDNRTFVDGGIWANSPALDAVISAHYYEGIQFEMMRLLSLGNGETKQGSDPEQFKRLRPLSPMMIRSIINMMFGAQSVAIQELTEMLLPKGNFLFVNPDLPASIELDDVGSALDKLPPRATADAADLIPAISKLFGFHAGGSPTDGTQPGPPVGGHHNTSP